jgi:hypothetical protein
MAANDRFQEWNANDDREDRSDHTAAVIDEIRDERERQITLWSDDHDDAKNHRDWVVLLGQRLDQCIHGDPVIYRQQLVRLAATAAAAIEAFDRKATKTR